MREERMLVLLRGVNVGGRHKMAMLELREVLGGLGCERIDTYLQSGNVVCAAHGSLTAAVLGEALGGHFGFPVPVVMRSARELGAAVGANPFAAASPEAVHVVFLEAPLAPAALKALEGKRLGQEKSAAVGREIFLYLPHGFGRSRLALGATAEGVAGNPTVRSWKTVLELREMVRG